MVRSCSRMFGIALTLVACLTGPLTRADDQPVTPQIQEEIWALPIALPMIAYVVRPIGPGPFPLLIMNHGVSLNQQERAFFPLVEFRDAATWFAGQRHMA